MWIFRVKNFIVILQDRKQNRKCNMKHYVNPKFIPKDYRQCTKTVMDNIADPDITFDENGICNYYYQYLESEKKNVFKGKVGEKKLQETIQKVKAAGKGKKYDCVLGVSGGVDSTYLAYLLKKHNVRTLLIHFDNGWNSELAVKNIENIVKYTNFDLETYVMDWEEFKDIQRAYFKASVLDLEIPTDLMIFGALFKIANKHKIKYVASGNNTVTEDMLPNAFYYSKFDIVNLRNIHKKFGTIPLKKLPQMGFGQWIYYSEVKRIKWIRPLNYIPYNKTEIKKFIKKELNWTDYGGKHYESIFTRFYQGYILPKKFGIDKRKAHLSNLIASGQITREEALQELEKPPMPPEQAEEDKKYVAKKLGFTDEEFEELLNLPNVPHEFYGTDKKLRKRYFRFLKIMKPITSIIKKLRK